MKKAIITAIMAVSPALFGQSQPVALSHESSRSGLPFRLTERGVLETSVNKCLCYRHPPSGDPYPCAPIVKTCHGGPGNYPYQCKVCEGGLWYP